MDAPAIVRCTTCTKLEIFLSSPLKACSKCKSARYCSIECQKKDWKTHRLLCIAAPPATGTPQQSSGATSAATAQVSTQKQNAFGCLTKALSLYPKHFADNTAKKDVYGQLIDVSDNNDKNHNVNKILLTGFNTFLDSAEKAKDSLLPVWWSQTSREECIALATGGDAWFDLRKKVDKKAVVELYGDQAKLMTLRLLAESVYGEGVL